MQDSSSHVAAGVAPSRWSQVLAWLVHAYTALGLVLAGWIAAWIVRGGDRAWPMVFVLMLVATLIDATDGMLARLVRVKEVLPQFDGRRLDDLIDFLNYTFLPLLVIWRAELVPAAYAAGLFLPLLASAYGFCQADAKTDDGFFLGFPSYWNVLAFYLYVLAWPPGVALAVLLVFALLTFVPLRYLYPSQPGLLNRITCVLGVLWSIQLLIVLLMLLGPGRVSQVLVLTSLIFPAYYLGASWWVNARRALS